ncbi:hypothetical protein C3766_14890 [Heyndrickxia coagulans]|nr:hypothetical protein C3766_14890 [Heyndrickxia coagulans]
MWRLRGTQRWREGDPGGLIPAGVRIKMLLRLEMQGHCAHLKLGTVETKIPLFYAKIKREIVQPPVFNPMTAFSRTPNV